MELAVVLEEADGQSVMRVWTLDHILCCCKQHPDEEEKGQQEGRTRSAKDCTAARHDVLYMRGVEGPSFTVEAFERHQAQHAEIIPTSLDDGNFTCPRAIRIDGDESEVDRVVPRMYNVDSISAELWVRPIYTPENEHRVDY